MKRLLSCYASDLLGATKEELKQSILSSEGRIIMGETVVTAAPLIAGVTNAEMMTAFGCDLLVLNELDVFHPEIVGFYDCDNPIAEIKRLTGRLVGINLEPVDSSQEVQDQQVFLKPGRQVSPESLGQAQALGVDFIMLTGNPATGVSMAAIRSAIGLAKEHFEGLIFAGKMHGAGLGESVVDSQALLDFVDLGGRRCPHSCGRHGAGCAGGNRGTNRQSGQGTWWSGHFNHWDQPGECGQPDGAGVWAQQQAGGLGHPPHRRRGLRSDARP